MDPEPGVAGATSTPTPSLYKSRHVSLQSRIESIAASSLYESRHPSQQDVTSIYKQNRSTSYIMQNQYKIEHESSSLRGPIFPKEPKSPSNKVEMSRPREAFFVAVVVLAHFMTQAALGQALAPIDIIAADFNTRNPGEQSWYIAAYSLTVGTFILISGRLGDNLGHKRVFAFGYAWFGVWSAFAGFSVYPGKQIFFMVCRAMQGIGPALLLPNALALFGRAYSPGIRKNIVFSLFGASAPMGYVAGAASGSLFGQLAWWPWAFWSFGIACIALSAFSILLIPQQLSERPMHRPSFDWTGSLLGVIGLVLVNIAWNNGPLYGWGTPHVYFLLIIGLIVLAGFVWTERRAENPLLPLHALNSTVGFVLACIAAGWGAFGIWVFYSWRWLEVIRGCTPLSISAQFAPAVICGLLAAGLTGFLLTHTPVSFVMMVSMMAFAAGTIIAGTMPAQQTYWTQMFFSVIIMPFGMDMSFPAASLILSNHMPRERQGLAASLINTVLNYSISISLGIAGTVETTVIGHDPQPGDLEWGFRCAFYTAISISALGVVLGALYFCRSLIREGWKVMDH
ncbi:hypothetical protein M501DRAFT_935689 [Patellaria atrata CBS 101060]|uniref:Major facilitator superfamily (MFS) profile domain-containing protein n=1 Tax=Patellaria atrata CBS 101060 TaxID=1346257 RepID=A0A9P4S8S8_9PEZI|nr:hypothetical protein M501DRAFT_935689 [Patellaria atrata CBS 101060]